MKLVITKNYWRLCVCGLIAVCVWQLNGTLVSAAETLDFTRDIRPILSNNCFLCHGPDEAERYGGLRLDVEQGAYAAGDSGLTAITPGDLDDSEILRRITSDDPAERMPPPEHGPGLEPVQIEKIKQWIQQGAPYAGHWAYEKPVRPELPTVGNQAWPRNAIDHFVLAKLEANGLTPRPQAERSALIRRLSLDLTGLPPTPQQVQEFADDTSADAYEKLVDRLLADPAYGEHWARMWLDLARYADSAGYADDPPRTIWAFRDYVIKSLNANKPFDQFTIEQLAGDLLPNATDEQLIATAFHRNTLTNNEGGTNDEEFRNAAVVDRVNTTYAVWMGTTMACAQCHTHKYDPITHAEYFQSFAIFNSTADADKRDESPRLDYYTAEQKQQKADWQAELAELKVILQTPTPDLQSEFKTWLDRLHAPLQSTTVEPLELTSTQPVEFTIPDQKIVNVSDQAATNEYQLTGRPDIGGDQQEWTAIQLRTFPQQDQPARNFVITQITAAIEPADNQKPVVKTIRIELPGKQKMISLAEVQVLSGGKNVATAGTATQSSTDYNGPAELAIDGNTNGDFAAAKSTTHTEVSTDPWWQLELAESTAVDEVVIWNRTDNQLQSRLDGFVVIALDADEKEIWRETVGQAPQASVTLPLSSSRGIAFKQAFADYHQAGFEPHFVLDVKEPDKRGWAVGGQHTEPHTLTILADKPFTIGKQERLVVTIAQKSQYKEHLLRRFAIDLTADARVSELAQLPGEMQSLVTASERSDTEQHKLQGYFLENIAAGLAKQRKRATQLQASLNKLKPYTVVPLMQELPADKQRKTHIQIRGNFMSLGAEVQPGLPSAFNPPGFDEGQLPTRLDLAQWLVDENNPLTSRVIANRYWEKLFGAGIVLTSEEFGSQGELPSHPQLLDWLALELIAQDWDLKAFIRVIVTSAAYRQSSTVSQELLQIDPDNRLISRGPRFRLSAEMVRDQALAVSGLLSRKMYGPPVNPPQPNMGLNAAFGGKIDWKTSAGEDKFRRGLYTTWRRSNPYPSMAAFDAPNRETCIVRRDRTNTPLQAFVTLNDPVYVEAAQALGRRMAAYSEDLSQNIAYGIELCLARKPTDLERNRLVNLFENAKSVYAEQPEQAVRLATDPIGKLPENADAASFAAWTLVGNVLLNLDEMLMKP